MSTEDHPPQGRADLERDVEAEVRRLTVESQRLAQAFASRQSLHATDLEALIHVMDAEARGTPLTPGDLSASLGISSGATTAAMDRLAQHGLVRRDRDDVDRRRVHLRFTTRGRETALAFFGGLQEPTSTLMGEFTEQDLTVVHRFLTSMSTLLAAHRETLEPDPTSPPSPVTSPRPPSPAGP